jgi:hypothetical protein
MPVHEQAEANTNSGKNWVRPHPSTAAAHEQQKGGRVEHREPHLAEPRSAGGEGEGKDDGQHSGQPASGEVPQAACEFSAASPPG